MLGEAALCLKLGRGNSKSVNNSRGQYLFVKGRRGLSQSKTRSTLAVFVRPEREMTRTTLVLRCNVTCCESLNETLNARQNFQKVGNEEGVYAGHLTWCLITSPSLTRDCLTRLMGRR